MRWSTFRTPDGDEAVGVWSDGLLHPVPGPTTLLGLIAEDRLDDAAVAARAQPGLDPARAHTPSLEFAPRIPLSFQGT